MQKHPGEEGGRAEDERVKRPPPPAWPSEQYQGGRRDNEQAQQDADEAKPGRIEVEVEEPAVRVFVQPFRPAAKRKPQVRSQAVK